MANRFLNNIKINDSYTLPSADGTANQIIKTNGAGQLSFVDQGDVVAGEADKALSLTIRVKNTEAVALTKGQVVCAAPSATPPSGNVIEVKLADNNGTDSMPAIGVLNEGLDAAGGANDEGEAIMFGRISGINTSAFNVGDEVFVSDTPGALTATKPTGVKYIQKIGVVMRDDASNGTIEVFGAGRTNDVPTPLYIDHANQRVGIGVENPSYPLDVSGIIRTSTSFLGTTAIIQKVTALNANGIQFTNNSGSEKMRITDAGNVGIGTSSPIGKIQVGANTFSGNNGVYTNDRIGSYVAGSLTSMVYASTYNNSTFPDYGMVFIHGPNTSSYNVWSISPDGPAKGNGLNFIYGSNASNIHTIAPKVYFSGNGNVGIGTASPGSKLHVHGTSSYIKVSESTNSYNVVEIGADSTGDGVINLRDSGNGIKIKLYAEAGAANYFNNGGNVGIGTTSPGYKLDVAGNIKMTETAATTDTDKFIVSDGGVLKYRTGAQVLSDIGAQPAGTYNTIIGTDTDINTSGSTIIDNIYVTDGVITSMGTRTLTAGDIGAAASSHNHDDRYYTETEINSQNTTLNETLAQLRGWVPAYSNSNDASVRWNREQDAVELQSDSDGSTGIAYQARRVKAGEVVRFTVMLKADAAYSSGLYLRLYQYDGDMPDGKTHVSNTASHTYVQEDSRGDTGWAENSSVAASWTTFEREYTAPVDGYVSLVVLNWTGIGTNSLYIKTPDIQTVKAADSNLLDGIDSGSFLRSDAADTATGSLTFSGATTFNGAIGNSTTTVPSVRIGLSTGNDPQIQFTDSGYNAHIDFGSSSGDDYNVRIIHSASNTLNIQSASNSSLKINNQTVWNAGNDGAGSGLDADTLDGQHASAFLTSLPSHNHDADYVNVTGDTMTGNLEISKSYPKLFLTDSGTGQASIDIRNSSLYARWILDTDDLFRVYNQTSGFDTFAIKSSGNVGIGTASPAGKLEVNTGSDAAYFTRTAGDDGLLNPVVAIAADSLRGLIAASGDSLTFRVRATGTSNPFGGTSVMSLLPSGNVGIGTTSPGYKLDVNGNAKVATGLYLDRVSGQPNIKGIGEGTIIMDALDASHGIYLANYNAGGVFLATGGGNVGIGTATPDVKLEVVGTLRLHDGTDQGRIFFRNDRDDVYIQESNYQLLFGAPSGMVFELDTNNNDNDYFNVTHRGSSRMYIDGPTGNVGIGTTDPASNAKLTVMGNQTFGLPGNGNNTDGRFISIEGNTDSSGEGSGRIFFTEHNSTTASMDNYGMSIGYRGGATTITGASGNSWTGLSQIGNGQWGMWGHNNDATGSIIMRGDRAATYVDFVGNNITDVGNMYVANAIYHQGDTDTYILFNDNTQRFFAAGEEMIKFNSSIVTINEAGGNNDLRVKGNTDDNLIYSDGSADKVGIGTASPSEKLEVNGNIKHTGLTMTEGTDVDQVKTFTMTYQLAADTWTDTGINAGDLSTGTYIMQVYADDHSAGGQHYDEYYSATISWFGTGTNSTVVDEIVVHRAGHAPNANDLQFRTQRHSGGGDDLMLQVKANLAHTAAMNNTDGRRHTYKFRRLI